MTTPENTPIALAIGIPTINRKDLLDEAIKLKYHWTFFARKVLIIDNGKQGIEVKKPWRVINTHQNFGVAGSWNLICTILFRAGYTHVLMLNDDIIIDKHAEEIEAFIKENPADIYHSQNHFCAFIIDRWTFAELGPFDDRFWPAYYEDNDYVYRAKLAGKKVMPTPFLDPVVFRNSQSIAKQPELNHNFNLNRQRYIEKWGGLPNEEKYTVPFNGVEQKPIINIP